MDISNDRMRAVFVGGDARMMYAARRLRDVGASVAFAAENVDCAAEKLASAGFSDIEIVPRRSNTFFGSTVVLPLPVSRDGVSVSDPIVGENIPLGAFFSLLAPGTCVFCGMAKTPVVDAARNNRTILTDYYADESFLIQNAALTAEGAIAELIRLTPRAILGSRAVIFGYGRCASQLSRRLICLGARVTVVARSAERRAAAIADGADAIPHERVAEALETADYAVNTIAYPVIGVREAASLAPDSFVLELADRPGICEDARSLIRVERAAALPGRFSPRAAGELIADAIVAHLACDARR